MDTVTKAFNYAVQKYQDKDCLGTRQILGTLIEQLPLLITLLLFYLYQLYKVVSIKFLIYSRRGRWSPKEWEVV